MVKGAKGFMALLGLFLTAKETFEAFDQIESSILGSEEPQGKDVKDNTDIDALLDKLEALTKENERLRKQLEGRQ